MLAEVIADVLRTTGETDRWQMTGKGFWCHLAPKDHILRTQGWKLHLSATILSAETVLARVLPVLLKSRSSFKFASTLERVDQINARHTPRGHSGKFITIYPESDEVAVRLARELHEATAGLTGPRILSDRPYVPGSLVHYRYGAFVEERRLTNDGMYAWVIFDPDGNPVEDRRDATYLAPAWASCPFPVTDPAAPENSTKGNKATSSGSGVLIGDRFLIRVAIRHSNKGGVYRAIDADSGAEAVVKEARPHVATDLTGRDVRDLLRGEARALERARPAGVAPRLLTLFEQGEHLFLAQELVPGIQLRQWVLDGIRNGEWRLPVPGALEMAGRVAELMAVSHQAGLIVRDFNPTNIMVRPDGELRLIDLELAVVAGGTDEVPVAAGTPTFSAPEQMQGAPPAIEADYYSLGATICFVVTGAIPVFLADLPKARPLRDRLADWLTVRAETINLPADIQALILGLMDDEPQRRWTASAARSALTAAQQPPPRAPRSPGNGLDQTNRLTEDRLTQEQWQEAVDGCVGYLLATMNPAHDEQLWRATCYHAGLDQCSVQAGAAGIVGVLTRYFELTGDERLPAVITTAGRWIAQRVAVREHRFPSLYFGEAGIAWSLYDAGRAVGDDQLMEQGLAFADMLPVSVDNPDLTHGTAGLGLTFLHLWLRTGNEEFAERAGESLLANASVAQGVAMWGSSPGVDTTAPYWCHGSAGIGSFLTRLHRATGDDRYGKMADLSAQAVLDNSWRGVLGQCHGLAGNGDFLLDMAETADDMAETAGGQPYEAMAHHHARVLFVSRAYRDGLVVFPDEQGELSASWAHGVSGILSFFLRLRHRSPRLWMVDSLLERSDRR